MRYRFLRPLLIFEFLVAIQAVFAFWSQVGGQYHLDLMYWPWKFGIGVLASVLITGMTAALVRSGGVVTRGVRIFGLLLILVVVVAGGVTYYYHLNEPDEGDQGDQQTTITRLEVLAGSSPAAINRGAESPRFAPV